MLACCSFRQSSIFYERVFAKFVASSFELYEILLANQRKICKAQCDFDTFLHMHINAYADISSGARSLNFGLSFHLHPCCVCVCVRERERERERESREGSCEFSHLCRLI